MNILFLSIGRMDNIEAHGLYPDLLRQFRAHGDKLYIVSQLEKRNGLPTEKVVGNNVEILYVKTGNITKCGMIEKAISTILISSQYKHAIKKYFSGVKFDLILYPTPPITLANVVLSIKKKDDAHTYLLLKDIFPQNAVDLEIMRKNGLKGLIYKYFRRQEKKLYAISDHIGCMSQANVDYVIKHNPEVDKNKVELCSNSIEVEEKRINNHVRVELRKKYRIPLDKLVFVYGGNLGKPQGIPFIIDCLWAEKENPDVYFLIVGDGTEYGKLEHFVKFEKPKNVKLMNRLPKDDYDRMIAACDVGLIFLDHRFTIPNFPSRLLSYMQAGLPVLACTDPNTDIGKVIVEGGFGWWCESKDTNIFRAIVCDICQKSSLTLPKMKENAWNYLVKNYSVKHIYKKIIEGLK